MAQYLEHELSDHLQEDIKTLIDTLTHPDALEISRVRSIGANICRKWLLDKGLVNLGIALGEIPTLPTLDTSEHFRLIEKWAHIDFYCSGGISLGGVPFNSFYRILDGFPGHPDFPLANYQELNVSKFLSKRCAYSSGIWFRNADIIRYFANKAGGVHYDPKNGKPIDKKIEETRREFTFVAENSDNRTFDKTEIYIDASFNEKLDFAQLELMSIAQALCNVRFDGTPFMRLARIGNNHNNLGDDILLGHTHHMTIEVAQ